VIWAIVIRAIVNQEKMSGGKNGRKIGSKVKNYTENKHLLI
jgi:hypothetical protein